MSAPAITYDLDRCVSRLEGIKARITGAEYADQRAVAAQAMETVASLIVEMTETLNEIAGTSGLSKTDRGNIRAYVHDGFVEAVDLADERMAAVGIAAE